MSEDEQLAALLNPEFDRPWKIAVGTTLSEIRQMTARTNGRVTRLEKFMFMVSGGLVVVVLIAVPLFLDLVQK